MSSEAEDSTTKKIEEQEDAFKDNGYGTILGDLSHSDFELVVLSGMKACVFDGSPVPDSPDVRKVSFSGNDPKTFAMTHKKRREESRDAWGPYADALINGIAYNVYSNFEEYGVRYYRGVSIVLKRSPLFLCTHRLINADFVPDDTGKEPFLGFDCNAIVERAFVLRRENELAMMSRQSALFTKT